MAERLNDSELRQIPPGIVDITVLRHGSKVGRSGPLSLEGELATAAHFRRLATDISETDLVEIYSSDIQRTLQTAQNLACALAGNPAVAEIRINNDKYTRACLTEGTLSYEGNSDLIARYGGYGWGWFFAWLEDEREPRAGIKTGRQVVSDFSIFLGERLEEGGKKSFVITHAPVMAAFLYRLQQKTGVELLDIEKDPSILDLRLPYLKDFSISSEDGHQIGIEFDGVRTSFSSRVLGELIMENAIYDFLILPSQRRILDLVSRGFEEEEVARIMGLDIRRVRSKIRSVCRRLGVTNKYDAVEKAKRQGELQLSLQVFDDAFDLPVIDAMVAAPVGE